VAPHELTGALEGGGRRFAVVVSRFNRAVTAPLLAAALDALAAHAVAEDDVVVAHVPGAFEVPFAARRLAASGRYDAVICLGAIVRGETPHFEYLAREVTRGLGRTRHRRRLHAGELRPAGRLTVHVQPAAGGDRGRGRAARQARPATTRTVLAPGCSPRPPWAPSSSVARCSNSPSSSSSTA
jgi:6,7-dimethyl-8-ribityllumazine synthase